LAEETDVDGQEGIASHFELYHRAMSGFGARTAVIDRFLDLLRAGETIEGALQRAEVQEPIRRFVGHTFGTIASDDLCAIASAFTFGREDLLPDVFQKIVRELNHGADGALAPFKYYLLRHIQLDGDEHGPMAARLIDEVCGSDDAKWRLATRAAVGSLQARILLWDSIHDAIKACR
jgi:hypothetical protein